MKCLLDVDALAELLSISPWTVRSYAKLGKLRPIRVGRRVLFEETEVERFLAGCRQEDPASGGVPELVEVGRG
jgi:excisionase family DNA binding protein